MSYIKWQQMLAITSQWKRAHLLLNLFSNNNWMYE